MSFQFWLCAVITAISAYVSLGDRSRPSAGQTLRRRSVPCTRSPRSVAVAAAATIAPFTSSVDFVAAVALVMVIVQGADAVVGARIHDRLKIRTLGDRRSERRRTGVAARHPLSTRVDRGWDVICDRHGRRRAPGHGARPDVVGAMMSPRSGHIG